MKIAVDVMGGDYSPGEIVLGAVNAARKKVAEVILVGPEEQILPLLQGGVSPGVEVVHTGEWISMDEAPATALRRKRNASILVATGMVKDGKASAVLSAGSTGAQMAAALLVLGRVEGVQRPAIGALFPGSRGPVLLMDVGANVDCKPVNLLQFAQMGSIYAEKVLNVSRPRVALLNIGAEIHKGDELTQAAFSLLSESGLNFMGNIEARDLLAGSAQVVVCDGFVGNSLLKFGEGMAQTLFGVLQEQVRASVRARLGAMLLLPAIHGFKKQLDYDEYGGAPLFGVRGVSLVCHGSAKAKAIESAVAAAVRCVESNYVQALMQMEQPEGVEA